MGVASLVLGILSLLLGILPLFPLGPLSGTLTLYLAAIGLPLGAVGVCLGIISRSEALITGRQVGRHTAGLSISVIGAIVCITWVGGLFYAQRKLIRAAEDCRRDPRLCAPAGLPTPSGAPRPAGNPPTSPPRPL